MSLSLCGKESKKLWQLESLVFSKIGSLNIFWQNLRRTLSLSDGKEAGSCLRSWENIEEVFVDLSSVELEIRKAPIPILCALGESLRTIDCTGIGYSTGIGGRWKWYGVWVLNKVLVQYCLSSAFSHSSRLQAPEIQGTEILSWF